jgi:hypothetical protein
MTYRATSISAAQSAKLKLREEEEPPVDMRTVRAEVSTDDVILGHWIKPIGLVCIAGKRDRNSVISLMQIDRDLRTHQCVFAFLSDYSFLMTATLPHGDLTVGGHFALQTPHHCTLSFR